MSMRFLAGAAIAMAFALSIASVEAFAQTYSIDAHVLAAGASGRAASPCFRLQATIAEPVAGFSASTSYSIAAGFRARSPSVADDDLFFSGFEACAP